jgi:hypothetical protein
LRDAARRPIVFAMGLALVVGAFAAARPAPTSAHDIPGMDRFMYALGQVESGGSYTAYNSSTGAYGKYQIIPSSWRAWADRVLGDPYAAKTPENQELVARSTIHDAWHRLESWPRVAYWWLTGSTTSSAYWSDYARSYVNKVMTIYNGTSTTQAVGTTYSWYQQTYQYVSWTGAWHTYASSLYGGGSVRWSDDAGATMTFPFVGKSVSLSAPKGPTRGKAWIYVDGTYVQTIDLYASSFKAINTVFTKTWSSSAKHRLTVKVVGTAGRPIVGVDQFKVGR